MPVPQWNADIITPDAEGAGIQSDDIKKAVVVDELPVEPDPETLYVFLED